MKSVRAAWSEALLALARENPRIIAVTTDSRGSAAMGAFAKALPNQLVECGIAEQNAVSIAAGLAQTGLCPYVCGPAAFLATRAFEQIKVDMAYNHSNVKVAGVSAGVSYGALGSTHHAVQDIAVMRTLPGMTVLVPADANQCTAMVRALQAYPGPAYIRMGRGQVPDVYGVGPEFAIGKANMLVPGGDAAILATGEMVAPALEAAALLQAEGIAARVLDIHTIKPLDEDAVLAAATTGAVVTVEEHSVCGGLGSAVAELLAQGHPVKLRILGLPDEPLYAGNSQQVKDHYQLNAQGIARAVQALYMERAV